MSALSDERLAEIRERVEVASDKPWAYWYERTDVPDLLAHVDHLTAKDARLRAGIEAMAADNEDRSQKIWERRVRVRSACDALLNPPTEGETDADA